MVPLTVFTPAYNRAELLTRCYEWMKKQTCKDFIWMIIDDGSTDNTGDVVREWQKQSNGFTIEYYYKPNGGLYTTYNEAISHIETELCVCIDSDDFMPENAVEIILDFWKKHGSDRYAGIVGLDYSLQGEPLGDLLPAQTSVNLIDLLTGKYNIHNGDRTNVVRTELYKIFAPLQGFPGEKDFNPHYLHLQISLEYDFLVLNENLRFVDYQDGGMTSYILRQYRNSPNSFAKTRLLYLTFPDTSLSFKLRQSIHYVSSCLLAKRFWRGFFESKHKLLTIAATPAGIALTCYILFKTRARKGA